MVLTYVQVPSAEPIFSGISSIAGSSAAAIDLAIHGLAAVEQERAGFFRALRGGMERDGFFGYAGSVFQEFERFD